MLLTSRHFVICKSDIRTNENIITYPQSIPKLNAVLDSHAVADDYIVLYKTMRANIAVGTN